MERLYICPRFWDRKHNIPLSPKEEEHPVLKIPYEKWKKFVVPNGATTEELKDSKYFIFERRGQMKNKPIETSYWYSKGKGKETTNVDQYNVIFKQNCHAKYPIPCCGKKPMKNKYKIGDKVQIVMKKKILTGIIKKIGENDKYTVDIDGSGTKDYHMSKLKKISNITMKIIDI